MQKRIEKRFKNNPESKERALKRLKKSDIDHMKDLQLDGKNARRNLKSLQSETNQGLGRQISNQLPRGKRVKIKDIIDVEKANK